jgi:general secretion pathway protein G
MKKMAEPILPGTGRGTSRRLVEGLARRRRSASPSVSPAGCHLPVPGRNREAGFTPLRRSAENGFTLVELMVVIVIIGLLATVVVINVMPATDKAAVTKAKADIATLEQGVEMYRLNKLNYPAGGEGLQAVVREGYVKRLPKDPWGNPYQYAAPGRDGRSFDIFSHGADGREGGEGEDADIGSWQS